MIRYHLTTHSKIPTLGILMAAGIAGWQSCSKQPASVPDLFPDSVFDSVATSKQFSIKASGSSPMVDDLEDGDLNGLELEGRHWSWVQFDDTSDGIQYLTIVRNSDASYAPNNVLYIKGGGWKYAGAGVSAQLVGKTEPKRYGNYDASVYSGIRFRVRAVGIDQLKVSIGTPETTPTHEGGICTNHCPPHFSHRFPVSENWVDLSIPFEAFLLSKGKRSLPVDPSQIKGIHFSMETLGDYEVWLDDLAFFRE